MVSIRSLTFANYTPVGPAIGARRGPSRRPRAATVTRGNPGGATTPPEDASKAGSSPASAAPIPSWVPSLAIAARSWPLLVRTIFVYSTQIAYRVLSQPFQPAAERLQARAGASTAVRDACEKCAVDDLAGLQDLCNSLVLAESVYKVVGRPEGEATRFISALKAAFPPGICSISGVQFAKSHVRHRFVVAEGGDAIYVAFMGTKLAKDFITNASVWQEEVRLDSSLLAADEAEGLQEGAPNGGVPGMRSPAAHRGFLSRARAIPIDALYHEASRRGKRLVLCGHSLGGAVAQLCTIQLLQRLPPSQHASVACFGFATPALGNQDLADMVAEKGWDRRIRNYLVPEDPIPHLLSARRTVAQAVVASSSASPSSSHSDADGASSSYSIVDEGRAFTLPPHMLFAQAASNITAVPGRMMKMVRPTTQDEQGKTAVVVQPNETSAGGSAASEAKPAMTTTTAPTTATAIKGGGTSGATHIESSMKRATEPEPAQNPRPIRNALGGVAQAPMRVASVVPRVASAAFGVAQNAAAYPMRAAPRYLPLGKQLFVTDFVTSEQPQGPPSPSRPQKPVVSSPSSSEPSLTPPTSTTESSSSISGSTTASVMQSWLPTWTRPLSSSTSSGEGDDDNVDIAAAAIAAGGLVPARLPARTLFPMHRMLTYRTRLLSICQEALAGHRWPTLIPILPYLGTIPSPNDVTATELLAPAMFPLSASTTLVAPVPPTGVSSTISNQSDKELMVINTSEGCIEECSPPPPRKLPWPLRLFRRPRPSTDKTPVEVVVRIEGRGLSNATAAWISGACVDSSGRASPTTMEIVSRPEAPSLASTSTPSPSRLVAPLAAFASWLALAVGWMDALRRLQPAGKSDYLLIKGKIPVGAMLEAQRAEKDPLLAAAVGGAPRLMVHVQSDFALHSLPLEVCSAGGVMGRITKLRGGFKDPSRFLQQTNMGFLEGRRRRTA